MTSEAMESRALRRLHRLVIPAQFGPGSGDEELHRNTPLSEMADGRDPGHDRCRPGRLRHAARGGPHRLRDDDGRAGRWRRTVAAVGAGAHAGRRGGARHGAAPVAVADAGDRRRPGRPDRVDAHPQPQPAVRDLPTGTSRGSGPGKYVGVWWEIHKGSVRVVGRHRRCRYMARTPRTSSATSTSPPRTAPRTSCRKAGTRVGRRCTRCRTSLNRRPTSISRRSSSTPEQGRRLDRPYRDWRQRHHFENQIEAAFSLYEELGVPGVKTGYAGGTSIGGVEHPHYDQPMVNHYRRVIQIAASTTVVEAHEMVKDTGERRTYPNILTRAAVRGIEWEAWSEGNPPEHLVEVPFTRMIGGPVSYTPGSSTSPGIRGTRPAALAHARAHPGAQHPRRAAGDLPRLPQRPPDDGRRPGELRRPARTRIPRAGAHHLGRHRGPQWPGRRLRHRRPP